jgi:hypothetical protein
MEAIGSGLVILVDGREVKDTNLTQVELWSTHFYKSPCYSRYE